jgi:hypothetical protein
MMDGRGKERDTDCKEQQALDDAKRAGLEPDDELKVIAEGEHARAGDDPEKVSETAR